MATPAANSKPTLTRWYIDTRPLTASTTTLPLLTTLQPADQTSVQKFYHQKDKHMSLASALLKYLFIHRTCRIPWSSIVISRTPDPHRRPCFIPDPTKHEDIKSIPEIEFNVSHQASMVAIVGTTMRRDADADSGTSPAKRPDVGVDITCVNERQSRTGEERSLPALEKYIEIFSEVFSGREMANMKSLHGVPAELNSVSNGTTNYQLVDYGYRLFYTYWALKEAYIKMTGEALLAPWLRELEFSNVVAPGAESGAGRFGDPYTGVKTRLYNEPVEDVRIEVVSLEKDYLFATAARGGGIGSESGGEGGSGEDPWLPFKKLDIERDVRPCATGVCSCLS
ncbi:4'-phosphopantetheinyl transferase family protein [Aspergillus lucknowensis]|uniref:holo-[acyl-carrier-protein] synthase n=1 Tax=Aspergillus lucknowensis TaxID=176173 RepID=A0ABR4M7N8_9EURO